jgi:hypothetical protein
MTMNFVKRVKMRFERNLKKSKDSGISPCSSASISRADGGCGSGPLGQIDEGVALQQQHVYSRDGQT